MIKILSNVFLSLFFPWIDFIYAIKAVIQSMCLIEIISAKGTITSPKFRLDQAWANYGSRAICNPRTK